MSISAAGGGPIAFGARGFAPGYGATAGGRNRFALPGARGPGLPPPPGYAGGGGTGQTTDVDVSKRFGQVKGIIPEPWIVQKGPEPWNRGNDFGRIGDGGKNDNPYGHMVSPAPAPGPSSPNPIYPQDDNKPRGRSVAPPGDAPSSVAPTVTPISNQPNPLAARLPTPNPAQQQQTPPVASFATQTTQTPAPPPANAPSPAVAFPDRRPNQPAAANQNPAPTAQAATLPTANHQPGQTPPPPVTPNPAPNTQRLTPNPTNPYNYDPFNGRGYTPDPGRPSMSPGNPTPYRRRFVQTSQTAEQAQQPTYDPYSYGNSPRGGMTVRGTFQDKGGGSPGGGTEGGTGGQGIPGGNYNARMAEMRPDVQTFRPELERYRNRQAAQARFAAPRASMIPPPPVAPTPKPYTPRPLPSGRPIANAGPTIAPLLAPTQSNPGVGNLTLGSNGAFSVGQAAPADFGKPMARPGGPPPTTPAPAPSRGVPMASVKPPPGYDIRGTYRPPTRYFDGGGNWARK